MLDLIKKELKLSLHPTAPIFLLLSAMLLIPNYPYYVVFFYTTLGVFFICQNGREVNDINFMLLLPISRNDIVKARMTLAALLECAQILIAVPFAMLRNKILSAPNAAGMDANMALFGLALIMLGIFNIVFFPKYYKNPAKVGLPFIFGSTAVFVFILIAEASCFIIPFVKDILDTPGMANPLPKLAALLSGALIYFLLTITAYKISVNNFKKIDL